MSRGICQVCGGEAHGFAYTPPRGYQPLPKQRACSMRCLDLIHDYSKANNQMVDPTVHEENALIAGGNMGGEYLESLNKPAVMEAFSHLTRDEWRTFVECVVTGFQDDLRNAVSEQNDSDARK